MADHLHSIAIPKASGLLGNCLSKNGLKLSYQSIFYLSLNVFMTSEIYPYERLVFTYTVGATIIKTLFSMSTSYAKLSVAVTKRIKSLKT